MLRKECSQRFAIVEARGLDVLGRDGKGRLACWGGNGGVHGQQHGKVAVLVDRHGRTLRAQVDGTKPAARADLQPALWVAEGPAGRTPHAPAMGVRR